MSKSIDHHQGYIQCLEDIRKEIDPNSNVLASFIKRKTEEHDKEIGKILEAMYKAYKGD